MSHITLDIDRAQSWISSHFGQIKKSGDNISVCAPWPNAQGKQDTKFHLSISVKKNLYRDWRPPNKAGSLVSLVMEMDGCTFAQALEKLGADRQSGPKITESTFRDTISSLQDDAVRGQTARAALSKTNLDLPPGFALFDDPTCLNDPQRAISLSYLESRGIPHQRFALGYCRYSVIPQGWPPMLGRIVLPYFTPRGDLGYWTARSVDGSTPKYFNPPSSAAPGAGERLWCDRWSEKKGWLCVVEGAFDAMALSLCGLKAVAVGGARLSSAQSRLIFTELEPEEIVIMTDADGAGVNALIEMGQAFAAQGARVLSARPPAGFKDYAAAWTAWRDRSKLRSHVESTAKPFDTMSKVQAMLDMF